MEEVEVKKEVNKFARAAKIIAIVVFSTVFAALLAAIISDFAIFSTQIVGFFVACLGGIAAFIFGFILMIFSIVLIFGIYLLEQDGFWPVAWAQKTFHEALADVAITQQQVDSLIAIRIVIVVVCFLILAASIVALALASVAKKREPEIKQGLTKAFSIVSIVFSSLGLLAAVGVILIFTSL